MSRTAEVPPVTEFRYTVPGVIAAYRHVGAGERPAAIYPAATVERCRSIWINLIV